MEPSTVQKIARVLHTLVVIAWISNLLVPPIVPGLVYFRFAEDAFPLSALQATFAYDVDDGLGNLFSIYLHKVWRAPAPPWSSGRVGRCWGPSSGGSPSPWRTPPA